MLKLLHSNRNKKELPTYHNEQLIDVFATFLAVLHEVVAQTKCSILREILNLSDMCHWPGPRHPI